jgi:Undecaprenyl-phosphate galactose phosphotransferase WbaP
MADAKKSRPFWLRKALNIASLCFSDSLVLLAGLYLGNWIIFLIHGVPVAVHYALAVVPVWCFGAWAARIVPAWGLGSVEELRRTQLLLLTVFGAAGVAVFLSQGPVPPSRIVYLFSWFFSAVLIPLARYPVKRVLHRMGLWGCPAVLYGTVSQVSGVIDVFSKDPLIGYIPYGVFTDDPEAGTEVRGIPVLGRLEERTTEAAVAVVPVAFAEGLSLSEGFDRVFSGYQRVVLLPEIKEDVFLWAVPRALGGIMGLEITSNLLNPVARILKRSVDLTLTLLFSPLWLPVLALTALAVWLSDRQNPFFLHDRIGKNGRCFRPVKFRTMVPDAEGALASALEADPQLKQEWEQCFKLRHDPRVTRTGRILRRTSLDELPQLLNVLAGQMSLVGPRPLPDYHHDQLPESARTPRARVRPGITGLWQVSGRSDTGTAGMEKWDTFYVRNWSLWLDVMILARTLSAVMRGKGAY